MGDILRQFLSRSFSLALLIVALAMIVVGFPNTPPNEALVSLLRIGIPKFFLAIWAHPDQPGKSLFHKVRLSSPRHYSLSWPLGSILYSLYYVSMVKDVYPVQGTQEDFKVLETCAGYPLSLGDVLKDAAADVVGRSILTLFRTLASIVLVLFVAPPVNFFVANRQLNLDKRPTILVMGLLLLHVVIVIIEPLQEFFQLLLLSPVDYLIVGAAVVLWALVVRAAGKPIHLRVS